jgi:hypothetical protein
MVHWPCGARDAMAVSATGSPLCSKEGCVRWIGHCRAFRSVEVRVYYVEVVGRQGSGRVPGGPTPAREPSASWLSRQPELFLRRRQLQAAPTAQSPTTRPQCMQHLPHYKAPRRGRPRKPQCLIGLRLQPHHARQTTSHRHAQVVDAALPNLPYCTAPDEGTSTHLGSRWRPWERR